MDKVYLISDNRERNGAIDYIPGYADAYNNNGVCEVIHSVEHVTIGDYIISLPSLSGDGYITSAVIERKTWKDLASSIKDSRAKNQFENMVKFNNETGAHIYYIIEGKAFPNKQQSVSGIAYKNLLAKLRHMAIKGVTFFHTKSESHTAEYLVDLSVDYYKLYKSGQISFPLQEYQVIDNSEQLIESIENIQCENQYVNNMLQQCVKNIKTVVGYKPKERLHKNLKKTITKDTSIISLDMWRVFKNVGEVTATALNNEFAISDLYKLTADDFANMSKSISNKAISSILQGRRNEETCIKIIKCIPGISEHLANEIIKIYPLKNLLSGKFCYDVIHRIKVNDRSVTKKINKAISILCPNYVKRISVEDELIYKALERFGDPELLNGILTNIKLSENTISFDAQLEMEYPLPILCGHNEFPII